MPFLPPARAAGFTTAARAALLRLHRSTAPPPVQILEAVLGVLDNAAIAALCRLGIPERLDRPIAVDALSEAVGADAAQLERLIRFCAARGWVRLGRDGRVRATRTTRFLRADHPGGWRAWIEFGSSPEMLASLGLLADGGRTGTSAFEAAHGSPFFTWMTEHPERHAVFDGAMDAGARLHALALGGALPWSGRRRVCDVGGGSGVLLAGLLAAHPQLEGVLLDLPDVVARAQPRDRLEIIGGDAFVAVPRGCDTYLFVNVLHDWGDDEAVLLLGRAAEALEPHGQIVVVDGERPVRALDTISARTDLLMLLLTATGKERTTSEFAALGARAGLRLERTVHLASADRAHVFTRRPPQ